jgi:hypothetical protein
MSIEVIDLVGMGHTEKRRKNVFNTSRFHAWMHYYKPGQKDAMHCHNADQTLSSLSPCLSHCSHPSAIISPNLPQNSPMAP